WYGLCCRELEPNPVELTWRRSGERGNRGQRDSIGLDSRTRKRNASVRRRFWSGKHYDGEQHGIHRQFLRLRRRQDDCGGQGRQPARQNIGFSQGDRVRRYENVTYVTLLYIIPDGGNTVPSLGEHKCWNPQFVGFERFFGVRVPGGPGCSRELPKRASAPGPTWCSPARSEKIRGRDDATPHLPRLTTGRRS